jgi:hypothetical protein
MSPDSPDRLEPGGRDRGFRERKREDHALILIDELRSSVGDLPRVRRILLELGRYYDPVLGGPIMALEHQRAIVTALTEGRLEAANALIDARYELYIRHRAHLGRTPTAGRPDPDTGAGPDEPGNP